MTNLIVPAACAEIAAIMPSADLIDAVLVLGPTSPLMLAIHAELSRRAIGDVLAVPTGVER